MADVKYIGENGLEVSESEFNELLRSHDDIHGCHFCFEFPFVDGNHWVSYVDPGKTSIRKDYVFQYHQLRLVDGGTRIEELPETAYVTVRYFPKNTIPLAIPRNPV